MGARLSRSLIGGIEQLVGGNPLSKMSAQDLDMLLGGGLNYRANLWDMYRNVERMSLREMRREFLFETDEKKQLIVDFAVEERATHFQALKLIDRVALRLVGEFLFKK